jgi:diacylglycerol kinase family enzyme
MIFRRPLLVANPYAGPPRRKRALAALLESFSRRFPEGIVISSLPETALDLPKDRDLLAIYGGDGTVHRVAGLSPPPSLPLLVLPGGTGNVLARHLGLTPSRYSPDSLWDQLPLAQPYPVRPGRLGSRPFVLMAGAGWDGLAVRRVTGKRLLGSLAYYRAGLSALLSRDLPRFSVTLTLPDGKKLRKDDVRWCLASRLPPYLGPFRTPMEERPDSPLIQVTLVCGHRAGIVGAFAGLLPGVPTLLRPFSLTVRTVAFRETPEGGPIPFQADGEAISPSLSLGTGDEILTFLRFPPAGEV